MGACTCVCNTQCDCSPMLVNLDWRTQADNHRVSDDGLLYDEGEIEG